MSAVMNKLFRVILLVTVILIFIYLTTLYVHKNTGSFRQIYDKIILQKFNRVSTMDNQKGYINVGVIEKGKRKLDVRGYPCLIDSPSLLRVGRCVRTVNVSLLSHTARDSKCVEYKAAENTPICIYDPKLDIFISGSLMRRGEWEGKLVNAFAQALVRNDVTDVLDIGCNIGTYTIKAAKLGKRVVALDANIENIRLLSRSLILGELTKTVTIIHNAVSDVYTNVTFTKAPKNIGGKRVLKINETSESSNGNKLLVETILLDDLEGLFHNKRVAIKMDIELSELLALKGGTSFLKNVDIKFMLVEMEYHKRQQSGSDIVSLLTSFGFKPYGNCSFVSDLTQVPLKQWPYNVCFKRQS